MSRSVYANTVTKLYLTFLYHAWKKKLEILAIIAIVLINFKHLKKNNNGSWMELRIVYKNNNSTVPVLYNCLQMINLPCMYCTSLVEDCKITLKSNL